jgi:ribosomal protein S18 acetylase RimI-like enzyme
LEGLRATGPEALDALLAELPEPPLDAAVPAGDPLASWLERAGFEPYAETITVVRALEGMTVPARAAGVAIVPYVAGMAIDFTKAEAAAMADLAVFGEMGSPTGYEEAEGRGAFLVARRGDTIIGFAQAEVPVGSINWIGVVPGERRQGVAGMLLTAIAREMVAARGTHLLADVEVGGPAHAFFKARGFRDRGRKTLLIRRAA